MDQLRKAWGWLQRQHFWVLTVVALLVALGVWWRGASTLWAEYQANRSKIDSQFQSASSVSTKPFHANDKVQSAQNEQIEQQQQTVFALWKQLYDRQTASVLKWPSNLSEEFRKHVEKLTFGADIPGNLRDHYNNYIRDHFPELPKIVGALEVPESGQGGGGMPGMGGGGAFNVQAFLDGMRGNNSRGGDEGAPGQQFEEPDFLVIWADQQMIRDELAPRSRPSAKQIWKTQEDVWVLEALLTIIANTNKEAGSDRFSNAAIRVIESLEVGRTAAQASRGKGRIDMVESAAPAMTEGGEGMTEGGGRGGGMEGSGYGEYGGGGRGMGMEGEYGGEGGRGGMGTDSSAASEAELFNNRYVGADGAPIPDPGDGSLTAFGTEFKRLPVRMQLWMDQRWLPQLISECANAPLQVEVQEVRINPADGGAGGGGGGRGGYGGGGGRGGDSYASAGAAGVEMMPESEPMMKTVVLQGTVYIFNPPTAQPAAGAALADTNVQ